MSKLDPHPLPICASAFLMQRIYVGVSGKYDEETPVPYKLTRMRQHRLVSQAWAVVEAKTKTCCAAGGPTPPMIRCTRSSTQ